MTVRRILTALVCLAIYLASYFVFSITGGFKQDPDEMGIFGTYQVVWIPKGFVFGRTWNYPVALLYLPLYKIDCRAWHLTHRVANLRPIDPLDRRTVSP